MNDLLEVSWSVVIVVGTIGLILAGLSFKGFGSKLSGKKDCLGVSWDERFGFLSLNGIFLLLGAVGIAIFKFFSSQ